MNLSTPQMLAVITRIVGEMPYTPRPYENVLAIHVTRDKIGIKYERYSYKEMGRETRLNKRHVCVIAYTPEITGTGIMVWRRDEMEFEDEEFTPKVAPHYYSPLVTESDYRKKLEWESLCYRPGRGTDFEQVGRELVTAYNRLEGTPRGTLDRYGDNVEDY